MTDAADRPEPIATYAVTPRPFGREIRFKLFADRLEVDDMRRTTKLPLAGIAQARLAFEPRGAFTRGFRCKLTGADRRTASFTNLSWRTMIQADDQREAYRAFVGALLPAVRGANPSCRFVGGKPVIVWALLALASAAMLAGVIYFAATAAPRMGWASALAVLAFALGFGWIIVEMVARNRPREFAPDAPPLDLLP